MIVIKGDKYSTFVKPILYFVMWNNFDYITIKLLYAKSGQL